MKNSTFAPREETGKVLQPSRYLIVNSHLQNKSSILSSAARVLHEKDHYPAVAHSAYYSCFQLLKHIWLHSMKKTEHELKTGTGESSSGTHDYLINKTALYISELQKPRCREDARDVRNKLQQLKKLRVSADYLDELFNHSSSQASITLSSQIIPILQKY